MQSFKSAGRAFQAIDAPTHAVIVPYGEGAELIAKLCGEWDPKEMHRTLQKAQRYSVNVFPNVWDKLQKENAATFGWLCVETIARIDNNGHYEPQPPSGGCVLKLISQFTI